MADKTPQINGLARRWELVDTAISSAIDSDIAVGGIHTFSGSVYVITSGTVLMTIKIQESPDKISWVNVFEEVITGNEIYRMANPFSYLKVTVSSYTSGQIDQIIVMGITT